MAVTLLAIELGTSYTTIFLSGNGIVLREPSVVAYSGEYIRAAGKRAKEMLGRAPERTVVTCPIVEGIIGDPDGAYYMLREFIAKILPARPIKSRLFAVLAVPCGLSFEERRAFEAVLLRCGIQEMALVEKPICAAYGAGLAVQNASGCFVVDIGAGTTDIAAISLSGIVEGCSICIGGGHIDNALQKYMLNKYSLEIGPLTSENVKESLASLFENDISNMTVNGTDAMTKNPHSVLAESRDISKAVIPFYRRITEAVESVINGCPPEISAHILRSGICVCGGGALVTGLEDYFGKRLKLPVTVPQDALYSTVIGAGKLVSDPRMLREIMSQN